DEYNTNGIALRDGIFTPVYFAEKNMKTESTSLPVQKDDVKRSVCVCVCLCVCLCGRVCVCVDVSLGAQRSREGMCFFSLFGVMQVSELRENANLACLCVCV